MTRIAIAGVLGLLACGGPAEPEASVTLLVGGRTDGEIEPCG